MKTITPYRYPRNGNIILPGHQMKKFLDKVFPTYRDVSYFNEYVRIELWDNCIRDSGVDSYKHYLGCLPDNIYHYIDSTQILTKRK